MIVVQVEHGGRRWRYVLSEENAVWCAAYWRERGAAVTLAALTREP